MPQAVGPSTLVLAAKGCSANPRVGAPLSLSARRSLHKPLRLQATVPVPHARNTVQRNECFPKFMKPVKNSR